MKFVSMFVLLALLLSAGSGMALAQEPPPEGSLSPGPPVLDGPVNKWTDVDLAFDEHITVPQVQAFYEQLTEEQREKVSELVAAKAGIPLDEWQRSIESERGQTVTPLWPREVWRQPIENVWANHPPGSTYAPFYYRSLWCDDDPDEDWVFYFDMYSGNQDCLRWTFPTRLGYIRSL